MQELKVVVTARMQVVAQIKGHELLHPENFIHTFDLNERNAELFKGMENSTEKKALRQIINALSDTEVRIAYVEHVVERLRNEAKAKLRVGGTKWSVNVLNLTWSMIDDPLNLAVNTEFKKTKFTTPKRRCNGRLFEQACATDVYKNHGVNGSGFCQKCYFPGVEDQYGRYKTARNDGVSKADAAKAHGFVPYPFVKGN